MPAGTVGSPPRERDDEEWPDERDAGSEHGERDASTPSREEGAGPIEPATFAQVYALFRQDCRGCHTNGPSFGLNMSTQQNAYAALIGGPNMGAAQYPACANKGYFYVIPGDPDASPLVQKLEDTSPCGSAMPPEALLSPAKVRLVRSWIAAGALDN